MEDKMNRKDYVKKRNLLSFEIEECNKMRYVPNKDNQAINDVIKRKKFQYVLLGEMLKNKK